MDTQLPDPPDAHLRAALRQASDHDAAPPPALDQRILAQAHAALAAPTWWRRALATVDGLLQPAPAAAFATVMLGSAIALMWHGDVPPEAMPGPAAEMRTDAAQVASPPAPTASAVSAQREATPPVVAPHAAPPTHTSPARARADKPVIAAPASPAREAAPAPGPTPAAVVATAAPPAPEPVPVPPPLQAATPRLAAAPAAPPAKAAIAGADVKAESAVARKSGANAFVETVASDPLAAMFDALPGDDARRAALRELQQAGRGRWQRFVSPPAARNHALSLGDASGRVLGRLQFDDAGVWWFAADGGAWHASLPPDTISALRARLGQ